MLPARTFSVSIACAWHALYERIWRPEFFPRWASGLAETALKKDGTHWRAQGPHGVVRIRFSPHNDYGVMDYWVDLGTGDEVHVPLRVIENGDGAEVMVTLLRQPAMDDERFSADARRVVGDLRRLKQLIEK